MNKVDWNPGKLLETSGYFWRTATLHAAVKLDVFSMLGKDIRSAKEIAGQLNANERATTMLLNALAGMGLLEKKGETYANTEVSSAFLAKDSPQYLGFMIMHHHHLVESWRRLDQAVLSGEAVRSRASFDEPVVRESFLMGMFNNAMAIAPRVAEEIDLSDRKHLLDLGGGPGTYAIHFCLKNPQLKATVYDLPTTRPFAEKTIHRFGLVDRVLFDDGNYVERGIDGTYDVAWLSHILHGECPQNAQRIVRKAVSALEPGGTIFIHEFILDNTMDSPEFAALFSLNMLLGTNGGQSYTDQELRNMLTNAGVKNIRRLEFRGPTDSGILAGSV